MSELKRDDIIQVTDPDNKLYMCLLIVDEVKSWGVLAYLVERETRGDLFYNIEYGKFEKVGTAVLAHMD